mgnify:CR=1 FL=1
MDKNARIDARGEEEGGDKDIFKGAGTVAYLQKPNISSRGWRRLSRRLAAAVATGSHISQPGDSQAVDCATAVANPAEGCSYSPRDMQQAGC